MDDRRVAMATTMALVVGLLFGVAAAATWLRSEQPTLALLWLAAGALFVMSIMLAVRRRS